MIFNGLPCGTPQGGRRSARAGSWPLSRFVNTTTIREVENVNISIEKAMILERDTNDSGHHRGGSGGAHDPIASPPERS